MADEKLYAALGLERPPAPETAPSASVAALRAALDRTELATVPFYHSASGTTFECCAMNSKGYAELKHVVQYSPAGQPMGTLQDDDVNRFVIYVMYGTTAGLDRATAFAMATHPGWGPDNLKLQAQIQELNPPERQRVDDMMILIGAQQALFMKLRILRETGLWAALAKAIAMTDDEIKALDEVEVLFEGYLRLDDAARRWKIPISDARLQAVQEALRQRQIDERLKAALTTNFAEGSMLSPPLEIPDLSDIPGATPPDLSGGWLPTVLGGDGRAGGGQQPGPAPPANPPPNGSLETHPALQSTVQNAVQNGTQPALPYVPASGA